MDPEPEAPFDAAGRARPDGSLREPDDVPPEAGALLELRPPLGRALSALPRPEPRPLLGRSELGRAVAAGADARFGVDGAGADTAGADTAGRAEPVCAGKAE